MPHAIKIRCPAEGCSGLTHLDFCSRILRSPSGGGADSSHASLPLRAMRTSPSDLEIGGELKDLPPGTTRYLTLDSLLDLPLVTYTVTDDPNFSSTTPTTISGIPLEELAPLVGTKPATDLVVAICDDKYQTNYPRAYLKAHHPLLVLRVNGEPPPRWPKSADTHGDDMGPYMISHPAFTPSFKFSRTQMNLKIPWGLVRLGSAARRQCLGQSRRQDLSWQRFRASGPQNRSAELLPGAHNAGDEGGQKQAAPG